MAEENVVQMPTLLERLAGRLRDYLKRGATNRQEWIDIQEGICLTLAEARSQFQAHAAFGKWCMENGFGEDVLNHQTRAAAVAMGKQPEALRLCFEETRRQSLEAIYRFDFPRFTNVRKTASRKERDRPDDDPTKLNAVRLAIRRLVEAGATIDRPRLAEELGVGGSTIQRATERERGRLEGLREAPPMSPGEMAKTAAKRFEATLHKAREEMRDKVRAEVHAELDVYLRHARESAARADRILAAYKGVMSKDTFRKIKACLHPDHNTFKYAAEALQAFSELEAVLVKPDDPIRRGPPLPETVAEMMARRAAKPRR